MPDGKGRPYHPKDVPWWAWAGSTLFGLGLTVVGLKHLAHGEAEPPGLGSVQSKLPGGAIHRMQVHNVKDIDERIRIIRTMLVESSKRPEVKEVAVRTVGKRCGDKWCVPEKDYKGEVRALFDYVRSHVRYVRDHARIDGYTMADKTLKLGGADCDDYAILLGALLLAVGYPVKLRVVQIKGSSTWSHIYLLVGLPPPSPKEWMPLDASVNRPAGWEVSRSQVVKQRDFEV